MAQNTAVLVLKTYFIGIFEPKRNFWLNSKSGLSKRLDQIPTKSVIAFFRRLKNCHVCHHQKIVHVICAVMVYGARKLSELLS